jgi:hypothetical protein
LDEHIVARGPVADRPASGEYDGQLYLALDDQTLYSWDEAGSTWNEAVSGGSGGSGFSVPYQLPDDPEGQTVFNASVDEASMSPGDFRSYQFNLNETPVFSAITGKAGGSGLRFAFISNSQLSASYGTPFSPQNAVSLRALDNGGNKVAKLTNNPVGSTLFTHNESGNDELKLGSGALSKLSISQDLNTNSNSIIADSGEVIRVDVPDSSAQGEEVQTELTTDGDGHITIGGISNGSGGFQGVDKKTEIKYADIRSKTDTFSPSTDADVILESDTVIAEVTTDGTNTVGIQPRQIDGAITTVKHSGGTGEINFGGSLGLTLGGTGDYVHLLYTDSDDWTILASNCRIVESVSPGATDASVLLDTNTETAKIVPNGTNEISFRQVGEGRTITVIHDTGGTNSPEVTFDGSQFIGSAPANLTDAGDAVRVEYIDGGWVEL